MKTRIFQTTNGLELIIHSRKSAVIFEIIPGQKEKDYHFDFKFTAEDFHDLLCYIETVANESWGTLKPKEADSFDSDYTEYYDRELDNNGYLNIRPHGLQVGRPSLESNRLYQFNKRKMESFLYDFKNLAG